MLKAYIAAILVVVLLALANTASARVTWTCVVTQEQPYHLELCTPNGPVWEKINGR